ncbi:MAG: nucleotidyltransferase domain-containing protein [Candidatus Paceibacterota bacterium]|jgi:predicted nucleotidyltransferase
MNKLQPPNITLLGVDCIELIKKAFKEKATEGHLLGSVARGDSDEFSDLDVWITFKDEDIADALEKRFEYYSQIGDIVHICEPHQNAPINGIQSFVLYKTKAGLLPVDYYLCPQSTSFITLESKKLFGDILLPTRETKLNPQKVSVSETYRIDFLICFIFNSIKKLARKEENALGALFREYGYLEERYSIGVDSLIDTENTFMALEKVIKNIDMITNEKQKKALSEIFAFMKLVQSNN